MRFVLPMFIALQLGLYALGADILGNYLNPLSAIALAALVISAANAWAIPMRYDLSYGLYLFHMPVMNAVIHTGYAGLQGAVIVTASALALAFASWVLIERPALSMKFSSAHRSGRSRSGSCRR